MRRPILSLLLLLASSSTLFALEAYPPAPDSHSFVRIRYISTTCAPVVDVSVSGSTITITSHTLDGVVCIATSPQLPVVANVGTLAAGVYNVIADSHDLGRLIVRDAESGVIVSPVGVNRDSLRNVQIFSEHLIALPATVLFDGVPADVVGSTATGALTVTPPPHAAGTVDVTLTDGLGTRKAVAAFTYFDPAAAPDPAVFEPVLFPVAYDGGGEFGSQWQTENRIGTGATLIRFRQTVTVKSCSNGNCRDFNWSAVLSSQSQSGTLLWVVRRRLPAGVDDTFRASSRIFELSRAHDGGTSLPVAREDDFKSSFTIEGVPATDAGRVTLRLYALSTTARSADVTVLSPNGPDTHRVTLTPVNGVAFAAIDLGPASPQPRNEPVTVTVNGLDARVWGLITATDNATQEVTALWPQ